MKTKKIVVKFGGSNLKRKEDIAKLIRVVKLYDQPVVIVVSALYGVTDILAGSLREARSDEHAIAGIKTSLVDTHRQIMELYIEDAGVREAAWITVNQRVDELVKYLHGIHCIGEVPDFVEDRVLSYGERLSSPVLCAILKDKNIPCREGLPENLGLFTNGEYRNAAVDFALSEKEVKRYLAGDDITIIPGFYGISPDAKVTLLGRGGSDYTAAAVARCIDAASIDLWKDVPGFMSADPKLVENPTVIDRLTYNEAAELCYFGARIAHPRTFEPAAEKKIPVRLFNINDFSAELKPVTVINNERVIKKEVIKSVTFSDDFGMLKLHGAGVGIKPGIMARVTGRLNDEGINIKSIITAQTCINILLSRGDLAKGLEVVKSIGLSSVDRVTGVDDISVIAVVGEGILEEPGIAARVFGAVSRHHINIRTISAGASDVAIYFIIDKKENVRAVNAIHKEIFV
jgi:aspartokinase/homoserine dehydrogenase 1